MAYTVNEVTNFIKGDLRTKLDRDFSGRYLRIFRERDLHSCTYFHLRKFLHGQPDWQILNEPFLRDLKGRGKGAKPDIVLLKNGKIQLIIELKFRMRMSGVGKKDQRVMKKAVKGKKWARKAIYIEAIVSPTRSTRRSVASYRNRTITLTMPEKRLEAYKEELAKMRKPAPRRKRAQ